MTTTRRLEIRRVYSASPTRAVAISAGRAAPLQFSILGIMSLAVAAAWTYAVWWPGDRFATRNLMLTALAVPVGGAQLGIDTLLGNVPEDLADPAPPEGTQAEFPAADAEVLVGPVGPEPEAIEAGQRTMREVYIDIWVWLVVMAVAGSWLALSGGAAAAGYPVTDAAKRRPMMLAAVIAALVAAVLARQLWNGRGTLGLGESVSEIAFVALALVVTYLLAVSLTARTAGRLALLLALLLIIVGGLAWRDWYTESYAICDSYPAAAPRIAAVAVMVVAGLAGAAMSRRSVGLHRIGVVLVLAAAITTVAALKYAESAGGIHTHTLSASTYAVALLVPGCYAVVLVGALALRLR
jgi:hypothetical protein